MTKPKNDTVLAAELERQNEADRKLATVCSLCGGTGFPGPDQVGCVEHRPDWRKLASRLLARVAEAEEKDKLLEEVLKEWLPADDPEFMNGKPYPPQVEFEARIRKSLGRA